MNQQTRSDTMLSSSDQWLQYYQQPIAGGIFSGGLSHDATGVTTSATTEKMLSPSNSSTISNGGHELNPKGSISKPIRRRSRVSKRTPITLLNATTTNFRALVQQFTGCRSGTLSFGTKKGPINLNFEFASQQTVNNGGYRYDFQETRVLPQPSYHPHHQQLHQFQDQNCMFSLDNNSSDVYPSSCGNPTLNNMQNLEDFLLENISLHELITDA
ncbi:VQ motif-containing protein [Actinidia rufa]|uniref:VQ motif-containing protein n=1 Tax=Actinidia rufa TaxID=165716 RepID=A0A7J0DXI3_9ERIC|nr:VQ motif-containing protein [Actinidia rufa]